MVAQVGTYVMTLTDTIMAGQVGTDDLAGVAIGSSLWVPIVTGINGILMAISPIVAQLVGSGRKDEIAKSVTQSFYLAIVIAVIVGITSIAVLPPVLAGMKLSDNVSHIAHHYVIGLLFGIIPMFIANALRYFFDAQGYTRISMIIILISIPFNALLNYVLIFGKFGMPALGGIGAGYATAITYWIVLAISVWMTFKVQAIKGFRLFVQWAKPSFRAWKELLVIGVPIGMAIFFEVSIFSVVTLMMGIQYSTETVAAHQSAISFTSLLFMVPLSISMALTIVVGFSVGGGRLHAARRYTIMGVAGSIGFLAVCSLLMYVFREQIAYMYTDVPEVAALAVQFLMISIIYQLSDAVQSSLQGVLRGYKDVQMPFVITFVTYWIIGIPSGYVLSTFTELGPFGYWIGIIIGLTGSAVGFWVRLRGIQKRGTGASAVTATTV
jgi:MATE family multidrug resistance protein